MITKYYDIMLDEGGGGEPTKPVPPKNYKTTTPQQRSEWNSFLDYAGKQNVDFDKDPKVGASLMAQYKKTNPAFSLTPDDLQRIQYEHYQLRKGDSFSTLKPEQLKYLRQGLTDSYLNRPVDTTGVFTGNTAKLYYPQKTQGDKVYGTDIEGYVNGVGGSQAIQPVAPITSNEPKSSLPDIYQNHDAALKRVNQLASIKGNEFLHGRGDALINANYIPDTDTESFRDSSLKAAKGVGIDPAMFWASAAEEGATGLIPDKKGQVSTDPDIDLNSKYPVAGFTNFGLDNFHDRFNELVKKGYLPKDFDYEKAVRTNENGEKVNSGNFKTVADALKAKAAFVKMENDHLNEWSTQNKVSLSPAANQFFTFIAYNGGPGTAHKLINYYKSKGLLEGDKFLNVPPPKQVDPGDSYGKVLPRHKVAQLSKKERIFE